MQAVSAAQHQKVTVPFNVNIGCCCRSGLDVPKVEVRFRDLTIGASVHVGSRALPTILNSYRNAVEDQLIQLRLMRSHKKPFPILHGISGALQPVSCAA